MNITISSPDGLGDFILRIPMLQAIQADGHRLQMFLRRPAYDLAAMVFPGVELHLIAADPYHPEVRRRRNPFREEHRAIRAFGPDLYLASLFALNFFDEVWFETDGWRIPVAGFSTGDRFWPSGTIADPMALSKKFSHRVEVPVALPELEKNRLLGSKVLGNYLPQTAPLINPQPHALEEAGTILHEMGVSVKGFWIACVGSRSGLRMKDWGEENWSRFLGAIDDDTPIVFLGNTKESDSIDRIRAPLQQQTFNFARAPLPIPVVVALAAKSQGYIGRDSGVMHLACAVERPAFAIYGGGHWGRFFPSGQSVALSLHVPCRGCNFLCPHERAHCVADVSQNFALKAWTKFLMGPRDCLILEEPLPPILIDRLPQDSFGNILEASGQAREQETRSRSAWWRHLPVLRNF